jgi:hypothetical protein
LVYKRSKPASATNAVRNVIDLAMFGVAEDEELGEEEVGVVAALPVVLAVKFWHGTVDDMLRPLTSVTSAH